MRKDRDTKEDWTAKRPFSVGGLSAFKRASKKKKKSCEHRKGRGFIPLFESEPGEFRKEGPLLMYAKLARIGGRIGRTRVLTNPDKTVPRA